MIHLKLYLFSIYVSLSLIASSQSIDYSKWTRIDTVANKTALDSIKYFNLKAKQLTISNKEAALKISAYALKKAVKIHDLVGMAESYNVMGITYKYLGDYSHALNCQLKSLNIRMIYGEKKGIAKACNNIALVYSLQNNYLKAIEYQLKSLKLKEDLSDTAGLAISYENLGKIYSDQRNSKHALNFYKKALKLNLQFKDSEGLAFDYLIIGSEYMTANNFPLARKYLEMALKIKSKINETDKVTSDIYNRMADLNSEEGKFQFALQLYKRSLKLNLILNDKRNTSISYLNIGNLYLKMGDLYESESYLKKSLALSYEINDNIIKSDNYELLMKLYENKADYFQAYLYAKLFKKLSDESSSINNFEKINELGIKYETDKKEKEIVLLNKDKDLKAIEISHQKSVRNYFIGIALIILVSTFFIFRLYKNKQKDNILLQEQKAEIEIQKKSITDSINYAYRIQKSILPSLEHFHSIIPQSFVFNKPKDIVSGDFYWLHETSPFKYSSVNTKVLLALADCTGHGVPGAFMSMMGVELLNEAVNESHSPAKILQIVDEGIRRALHTNNLESKKDGMDMALCAFDFEKNTLKFCGANRPVYRIRKGQLDIFVPQKTAVGFSEQGFVFENNEIDIQKDDCIYLFSDGYADQFGGDRDKKLTTKKFKDLLLSIQDVPIKEQGILLDNFIAKWAGNSPQVDDMLVIGLKV